MFLGQQIRIYIFIVSYYRQLSADIKMKNHKIQTSFVSPEGPKTNNLRLDYSDALLMLLFLKVTRR